MKKFTLIQPSDYYNLSDQQKEEYLLNVRNFINNSHNSLYQEMLSITDKKIDHYISDFFVHDMYTMQNNKNVFLWAVRNTGTWLIKLNHFTEKQLNDTKELYNIVSNKKADEKHTYYLVDTINQTIKKVNNLEKVQFTYQYETKEKAFEQATKNFTYDNYFKALNIFNENKNLINSKNDLFQLLEKVVKKAV